MSATHLHTFSRINVVLRVLIWVWPDGLSEISPKNWKCTQNLRANFKFTRYGLNFGLLKGFNSLLSSTMITYRVYQMANKSQKFSFNTLKNWQKGVKIAKTNFTFVCKINFITKMKDFGHFQKAAKKFAIFLGYFSSLKSSPSVICESSLNGEILPNLVALSEF